MNQFILTKESRVTMVTFGGKYSFTAVKGATFYFDFMIEHNPSYLVIQSGLNYYVFETASVEMMK